MIERSIDQIEEAGVRYGRMKAVGQPNDYFPARQLTQAHVLRNECGSRRSSQTLFGHLETFPPLDYPARSLQRQSPAILSFADFGDTYIRFFRESRFIMVVGSEFLLTVKIVPILFGLLLKWSEEDGSRKSSQRKYAAPQGYQHQKSSLRENA
jgi:hypothetical protein